MRDLLISGDFEVNLVAPWLTPGQPMYQRHEYFTNEWNDWYQRDE